jgi:hypothetical protein
MKVSGKPAAYLYDATHRAEERAHVLSILVGGLAPQAHGAGRLTDQAGRVGHDAHNARIVSCGFLHHGCR